MKIIKRGEIPDYTKRFTCETCGTIFEADQGEYKGCSQLAYLHDGLLYQCECPVCKKTAYIERGGSS